MKRSLFALALLLGTAAFFVWFNSTGLRTLLPATQSPDNAPPGAGGPAQVRSTTPTTAANSPTQPPSAQSSAGKRTADAGYNWQRITAFNDWAKAYAAATPEERAAMNAEGQRLAEERRPEFKKLIAADPERALEQAVKPVVRQELPAEIVAQLEQPVSARGDFKVYLGRPAPGTEVDGRKLVLRYFETPDGASYLAYVFGDLEAVMSQSDVAVRGVAVDRELALADSAVRQLDVGERVPAGTTVQETCPVSGKTTVLPDGLTEPIDEETAAVELEGRVIVLCDGSHVRVLDEKYRLTANIAASGGPGGAHPFKDNFPGTSSEAIGNFKALYIRAVYPDRLQVPNTEASAMDDMRNFSRFYVESSYGRLTVTPVFTPVVVLPQTREWYEAKDSQVDGLGLVHSDSRRQARLLGFDSGQFNVTIVRINGGPRLSGISWGGGDSVWVSWDGMDVINHECGHSIGRPHANFWNTGGQSAIGPGANQEYGNSFDVMGGGGGFSAHYNTISKRALGWLPVQNTHNPTANGVYRIFAYDQPLLEEGRRYNLRVPKDRTRGYNLEYHYNYNSTFRNSALVMWSGFGGAGHLIDTTPGTPGGKTDGGIQLGRTFSDPAAAIHLTVVGRNPTTPESLDIAVHYGNPATNIAPSLVLDASATSVAAGGSITFTAIAADANGDALAYHWECTDGYPGTNSSAFTRAFPSTDQMTVHCTVSDMKGGETRRHTVVTVGSPGRQILTGRITDAGAPVQGVLVGNGSKYAYTDVNGDYALADLTADDHTITALLHGYSFQTNDVTIVSGPNTLNISAAPVPRVSVEATAEASEAGTNGAFVIRRTGSTAAALDVRVMATSGTATKDTDYSLSPEYVDDGNYRRYTIPAGDASLTVSVVQINDASSEGPETVTLQIAEGNGYLGASVGVATLTLHDDDTVLPQIRLTAVDTEASEKPGNVAAFTLTRIGSVSGHLVVPLVYGGTAVRGADFPNLPGSILIPDGQASATVLLTPIDDTAVEGSENVTVTVPGGADYVRHATDTSVDLLILDDDIPVVTVAAIDNAGSEANRAPGVFLVSRAGPLDAPLKVYYGIGGSASHGTDYIALPAEVIIPAGAASAPVFITPYDDAHGEGPETVTLQLAVFNGSYLVGAVHSASLTITDNDDPGLVSVQSTSSACGEPSDTATLRFHLRGSRTTATTVRYMLSGTATPGVDYATNNLTRSVVLPAPSGGNSQVDVTVTPLNDALRENVETIVVTLLPDPSYTFYHDDATTILLRDDDQPMVSISPWRDSPTEGTANSEAGFFIDRTDAVFGPITNGALTVNFTITGTAVNGVDFPALNGQATIPHGASSVDLLIDPINDALIEGTETLTVILQPAAGYGLGTSAATIYLTDNETPPITIGFQATDSTTTEAAVPTDGPFRYIPVTLSAPSTETITTEYVVAAGSTAWANGIDWDLVDPANGDAPIQIGVLTFPPGVTSQNVKLRIYPDQLIEGREIAAIDLRNARLARISSSRTKHSLSIEDDTAAYPTVRVLFMTAASSVSEAASAAPLLLVGLDRTASNPVTVNYTVTGGTATPGSDFDLPAGTLTFAPGETSKLIPFGVLNDTLLEPSETVVVSLSAPSGAALGPAPTHTISLVDNDAGTPQVIIVATDSRATEDSSDDPAMFTVTRVSGGAALPLVVSYTVAGTATPGNDFAILPGTVTIPAGQASAAVSIVALDDPDLEPTETLMLSIAPDPTYTLGLAAEATASLFDDEAAAVPPTAFSQSVSVARNQASAITLRATDPSGDPLTYQIVASPTRGTLSGVPPNLTYLPQNNYLGDDSFTFRATDGGSTSEVATISITVINPTLVASNSQWRYYDAGTDLGSGWIAASYNDSTWSNGVARFGFGDAATTIVRGQPRVTYYFRQKFAVPAGMSFGSLSARVQRDDGVVVYLNGVEAFRDNMPAGPITASTRPSASVDTANETAWFPFNLSPALLRTGTNIIAAEVHQINGTSSDLGFAVELTATPASDNGAVTITATDPSATEPSDAASFTVTRLNGMGETDLHVSYVVSGSATPGVDYSPLASVATIPAGQASAVITVTPLDDTEIEAAETIVVTLAPSADYSLDTSITAGVVISDDDSSRQPPTAHPQSVRLLVNTPAALTLTATDPENEPLTFEIVAPPSRGALSGDPPFVTYTPEAGFVGTDAFTFRASDGGPWSLPAIVTLTVEDPAILISSNSVWRYHDAGVDLGTGWRAINYNDSAWNSGRARLGFGGDGEFTVLNGQPVVTYYFRSTFVTPDDFVATNATVSVARDDGVVVYLNGAEIVRDNMPTGVITYSTRASANAADDQAFYTFPVSGAFFRAGTNVLAAEVHQINGTSSDAGFNLQLRASASSGPAPVGPALFVELLPANTIRLTFPAANGARYAVESSQSLVSWQPVVTNTVSGGLFQYTAPTIGSRRFFRARLVP